MKSVRIPLIFALCLLLLSCKKEVVEVPLEENNLDIRLKWFQNDNETKEEFETGMKWYFTHLGASVTPESWNRGFKWLDEETVILSFNEIGFSYPASYQLSKIAGQYKGSNYYKQHGGADAGAWVMNTLNNSRHYYAIIGVPSTYKDFTSRYPWPGPLAFINPSSISPNPRQIELPSVSDPSWWAFEAREVQSHNSSSLTFFDKKEIVYVMRNGDLGFIVYGNDGLLSGVDPDVSGAGKPSKCMWCHESSLLPTFDGTEKRPGFLSSEEFNSFVDSTQKVLDKFRSETSKHVDFSLDQEHTEVEKIYFRFMEPSAKRLSQEWFISEDEVKSRLSSLKTHRHHEFPEMGDLYYRHEVQPYATLSQPAFPKEIREFESEQPNFLDP